MGLSSPVLAFLDECCIVGVLAASVCSEDLYAAFCWWGRHGHYKIAAEMFGRDLTAALPGLERHKERRNGKRVWLYGGVALR